MVADRLERYPQAVPYMLQALDFSLVEPKRLVLAGDVSSPEAQKLLRAAHSIYQPNKIVLGTSGAVESFAKTLPAKNGPALYVCTGTSCQPPTQDTRAVRELLE